MARTCSGFSVVPRMAGQCQLVLLRTLTDIGRAQCTRGGKSEEDVTKKRLQQSYNLNTTQYYPNIIPI